MKLKDWIKREKITDSELARRMGTSRQRVSYYLTGKVKPNINTLYKITLMTFGEVTLVDFLRPEERSIFLEKVEYFVIKEVVHEKK